MDKGYGELYAAIYKQALIDDVKEIKITIHKSLTEVGYNSDDVKQFISLKENEIEEFVNVAMFEYEKKRARQLQY